MEHSELRKGNYIYSDNKQVVKIKDVILNRQMCGFFPGVTDGIMCYDLSTLSPIKITED